MIKFRSSANISFGEREFVSFDIAGPNDENGNRKPDVHVVFSLFGRPLINDPVDFPLDIAVDGIFALAATIASHLPFPIRLPGLPKS